MTIQTITAISKCGNLQATVEANIETFLYDHRRGVYGFRGYVTGYFAESMNYDSCGEFGVTDIVTDEQGNEYVFTVKTEEQ